jgi:hypothetical protein
MIGGANNDLLIESIYEQQSIRTETKQNAD